MTSAMRSKLSEARTAADKSVKDKSTSTPLSELLPSLHLVDPPAEASTSADQPTAPVTDQPSAARAPAAAQPTTSRTTSPPVPSAGDLLASLSSPPAAMGTAVESRLLAVPMTEESYRLLQHLDRDLAIARRRPVNRVRLLTLALEQVLADPHSFHDRYLAMYQEGASWKRRVQARIPVTLADELPALRYTGESRQSAGMLVSIAVAALLEDARRQLDSLA